jgi:hypothetical protein
MKRRIERICLPKEIFDAMPASVRMIIDTGSCGFRDHGTYVTFDFTIGLIEYGPAGPGVFYTNTYICDRDGFEWRLTGCAGAEPDSCPTCGRTLIPSMSEVDGVISEFSESTLREAFENNDAERRRS